MLHSKERFVYYAPPKETAEYLNLLGPVSINTHTEPLRNCGYLYLPNLYIYATDDKAIVHPLQKRMVHAAKVFGGDFDEETMEDGAFEDAATGLHCSHLETGHSPFATQPKAVFQIIRKHLDAGRWNVVGFSEAETKLQGELLGQVLQKLGETMMTLGEIPPVAQ